jgi:hypothetical protein
VPKKGGHLRLQIAELEVSGVRDSGVRKKKDKSWNL